MYVLGSIFFLQTSSTNISMNSPFLREVIGDGIAGHCLSLNKLFFHLAQLSHWFTHHAVSLRSFSTLSGLHNGFSEDWAYLIVSLSRVFVGGVTVYVVMCRPVPIFIIKISFFYSEFRRYYP